MDNLSILLGMSMRELKLIHVSKRVTEGIGVTTLSLRAVLPGCSKLPQDDPRFSLRIEIWVSFSVSSKFYECPVYVGVMNMPIYSVIEDRDTTRVNGTTTPCSLSLSSDPHSTLPTATGLSDSIL